MKYSIDTSALLDGWLRYYPPDVFPPVWEHLGRLANSGDLVASDEVRRELNTKDDGISRWLRPYGSIFVPVDEHIQTEVTAILKRYPRLVDTAKNRSTADPFVIAVAKLRAATVITGERSTGNLQKPRIPDVCQAERVRSITLLELFREQGWIF